MFVYSRTPLRKEINWQVFFNGEPFFKTTEVPLYDESQSPSVESKLYASRKILSLERALPKSMAATFGFVDTAFALLALEQDSLPGQLAGDYEQSGVPLCTQNDIFADSVDTVILPAEGLYEENYFNYRWDVGILGKLTSEKLFDMFNCFFKNNKLTIRIDYTAYDGHTPFEISLYSIDGKCLANWHNGMMGNARTLEWAPREHRMAPGSVIVRITMGSMVQSKALPVF
jgi:hypothetical protein